VVGEALETVAPELLTADLATLEQRVQQVGCVILGGLIERGAAGQAPALPRPARCAACHGALKRRERPRPLVGLVGDYLLRRAYYWCAACKRGEAPLDAALGLGLGDVSPGLARVVARTTVDATFTPAVEQVREALGATLSAETTRRLAERIGARPRRRRRWPSHGRGRASRCGPRCSGRTTPGGGLARDEGRHAGPARPRATPRPDARTRHPGLGLRELQGGRRGRRGLLVAGLCGGAATGPGHARGVHRGCAGRRRPLDLGAGAPSWACPAWRWWRSWTSTTPTATCGRSATRSMARGAYGRRRGSNCSRISSTCTARPPCSRRSRPSRP